MKTEGEEKDVWAVVVTKGLSRIPFHLFEDPADAMAWMVSRADAAKFLGCTLSIRRMEVVPAGKSTRWMAGRKNP